MLVGRCGRSGRGERVGGERELVGMAKEERERLLLVQSEMRKMAEREMVDSAIDEEDEEKIVPFCRPPLCVNFLPFLLCF